MPQNLSELRRKNCYRFINGLMLLQNNLGLADFQNALEEIQLSFLALTNSFTIEPLNERILVSKQESEGEIKKMKVGPFIFSVFENTVIDINEKYNELAKVFVNLPVAQLESVASKYLDYETRCCDICGLYFLKPCFETPVGRMDMEDFCSAYHETCFNNM